MRCAVFISYQPHDWPWAEQVCQSLDQQGIPCRTELLSGSEGSLIYILCPANLPVPPQLIEELEKIRNSGLELKVMRTGEFHSPEGLGGFVQDLEFSVAPQIVSAAPKAYLEAPQELRGPSRRKLPILAAAFACVLLLSLWAIRASSVSSKELERAFAQQVALGHRVQSEHQRAQDVLESSQRLASQDRWMQADQALSQAIELDHGYAQAYLERGRARFWERQYEAAIQDFNAAIHLDPNLAPGATTLRILAQQAQVDAEIAR